MDPIFSTMSAQVLCAYEHILGTDWKCRNGNDPYGRLYYIVSGTGFVAHHGRTFILRPGRLYLIPANTPYSFGCPKQVVIQWLHFTASLAGGMELFAYVNCDYELTPRRPGEVKSLLARIRALWSSDRPGDYVETAARLLELLALFLNTADPERQPASRQELLRFRPVLDHIEKHLHESLPMVELAHLVHLEPSYFSRLFAKHFGLPPVRYVLEQKMKQARILLWQTDRTIESIGLDLGFNDGFHFSRTFKKITGIPPTVYRHQARRKRP
jgi:AraC family transcriptional regulator, arabinose operon regulatory protein